MLQRPFTPHRNAIKRDLKEVTNDELLGIFYHCLRWVNYFQDEDDLFVYLKLYEDVHMEVKRRELKVTWRNKDIKKYRIMGQKMYYGSLSVKELEWRLGFLIMYAIPVYRNIVRSKLYLVRERIRIIIEAIHEQHHWSELEYNKDILDTLNAPFFSYDNFSDMYQALRTSFIVSENIIIFLLFVFYTILGIIPSLWKVLDPDYKGLKIIFLILTAFVAFTFFFCCMQDMLIYI